MKKVVASELAKDPKLIKKRGPEKRPLLHWARDYDVMKFLISKGADVDAQDDSGESAIFLATERRDWKVVKLLLDNKASANLQTKYKDTPLHYAAWQADAKISDLLIAAGAKVNAVSGHYRQTPLHYVIRMVERKEAAAITKLMIAKGCDPKIRNKHGKTPYDVAKLGTITPANSLSRAAEVVKLLIDKGADVKLQDEMGDTPLHILARHVRHYAFEHRRARSIVP